MLDLVEVLRELGGGDGFEPKFDPPRAGEVQRIAIDSAKATEESRLAALRSSCATASPGLWIRSSPPGLGRRGPEGGRDRCGGTRSG